MLFADVGVGMVNGHTQVKKTKKYDQSKIFFDRSKGFLWDEKGDGDENAFIPFHYEPGDCGGSEWHRYNKPTLITKFATVVGDSLFFDKGDAADVEIYENLRDLSNGYFRGGECEALGTENFTPEFGDCKDITEIEDFPAQVCKRGGIIRSLLQC